MFLICFVLLHCIIIVGLGEICVCVTVKCMYMSMSGFFYVCVCGVFCFFFAFAIMDFFIHFCDLQLHITCIVFFYQVCCILL